MMHIRTAALTVSSALALSGLLAAPAHADRSVGQDRVASFFSQYRDAFLGQGGETPRQVEDEFLTPDLISELDSWAKTHNADPVFRSKVAPSNWSVKYNGSGAGHTGVILTETFSSGTSQDVWYELELVRYMIDDLMDAPA